MTTWKALERKAQSKEGENERPRKKEEADAYKLKCKSQKN
jgi:hypothetical protein